MAESAARSMARATSMERPVTRDIAFRVTCFVAAAGLAWAWTLRDEPLWRAASGIGYALGVAGLSIMALLMAYPIRKRFLSPQRWGPTKVWFRVHMMMGVLGPAAILLHSNFRIGSVNSSAAMLAMVIVASSGFVGRMLYTRIHLGLSAKRDSLREARGRLDAAHESLMDASPGLALELRDLHEWAGEAASFRRSLQLAMGTPRLVRLRIHSAVVRDDPSLSGLTVSYIRLLRRVAYFRVSERLFSTWHAFHLPLSGLLFVAAVAHVVAVHLY